MSEPPSQSRRVEFSRWLKAEFEPAVVAFHRGDAQAWKAVWSDADDVTVFGSWKTAVGGSEFVALVEALAERFQGCSHFGLEVLRAEVAGKWAHTVAYEHTSAVIEGETRTYTLRVTQIYREELTGWKVTHRHADSAPAI